MPVITCDVTLHDVDRDTTFAWLREPENHRSVLEGAFSRVECVGAGVFELDLALTAKLSHKLCYEFVRFDEEHGGRRIHVRTLGRRVKGTLRYSLSPAKPGTDTLVTLHLDYSPGRVLGLLVDRLMLRQALEGASHSMLQNLAGALGPE